MTHLSTEFTNEIGNHITIEIGDAEIAGVQGVRMFIAGPTSDIESTVTRKEAEVLHHQLTEFLFQTPKA
jgi:hypothetical protein